MRELSNWIQRLLNQLQNRQQRQVLSIRGDAAWCKTIFSIIRSEQDDALLLSDRIPDHGAVPFRRLETLLGSEASTVIVDLFEGMNPDLLCIASVLISSGGLLVLLSPDTEQWTQI